MRWTLLLCLILAYSSSTPWGFYAHKEINYLATFTLPPEMFGFYKQNIDLIKEWAVKADKRRYAIEEEGIRHYIDLDHYEKTVPLDTIPPHYDSAITKFSSDTILAYGIVPWHILQVKFWLTQAFKTKDYEKIIKLSADLGHYIADAHVPLHTTENYNGQLTGQKGIHGLWESRLPEIFATNYNFYTGKATYLNEPISAIWQAVTESYAAKDSVLQIEKILSLKMVNSKYSFERRGKTTIKVYSQDFSREYHKTLNNMVERRMKQAIYMVGCFWFTAWVDAGEPDLAYDLKQRIDLQMQVDSLSVLPIHKPIKGRMESH